MTTSETDYYIHSNGKHNKFWSATVEGDTIIYNWGRLGTKGQTKKEKYNSFWKAMDAYRKKRSEKLRKGYSVSTEETFQLESMRAKIVGTGAKIHSMMWVEMTGPLKFKYVNDKSVLADPSYNPAVIMDYEKSNQYYTIIITTDKILYKTLKNSQFPTGWQTLDSDSVPKALQSVYENAGDLIGSML